MLKKEYSTWLTSGDTALHECLLPRNHAHERLAEYLLDVSVLLGEEPNVHLIGVESSSTCPVLLVDWEAEPKVIDRVQKALKR